MRVCWQQGDSYPPLTLGDPPLDLTGVRASVLWRSKRDGRIVRRPLRVLDAEGGRIAAPSQAPAGPVEIRLHWPDGMVQTLLDDFEIVPRDVRPIPTKGSK